MKVSDEELELLTGQENRWKKAPGRFWSKVFPWRW